MANALGAKSRGMANAHLAESRIMAEAPLATGSQARRFPSTQGGFAVRESLGPSSESLVAYTGQAVPSFQPTSFTGLARNATRPESGALMASTIGI